MEVIFFFPHLTSQINYFTNKMMNAIHHYTSKLHRSGLHTDGCIVHSEALPSKAEEGVKESVLLSGFREEDLDDVTLVETMDTLVPLLREAGAPAPLVTFQGNNVMLSPSSLDLSFNQGNVVGELGPFMLGIEAWVLRPHPLRRGVLIRNSHSLLLHLSPLLQLFLTLGRLED